ncbi:MAG: crossover junction endodeoxyribonuclease RuvC, partial [Clostridiales bacterium]|nr:crossover junction endodeoxyribonuclease RuvC [Clostridiales bacterium]
MANEPVKKRIIGIDPGYAITGYGIIDKVGSKFEVVDYGVIETKAKTDFPLRLLAINDKIRFLLEQYKPDYMSVEELFMGHNHT